MSKDRGRTVEERVVSAAEAALAERKFVAPIDLLMDIGWLQPGPVDRWRQGRVEYLEQVVQTDVSKLSAATRAFSSWAERQGLRPSETAYVSRTRDRRALRFTRSGDPAIERAYRTHWISPALSERKRHRLQERQSRPPDLVVISPLKDWTCTACGGSGELLVMEGAGPLCLSCADMDHLICLPAGDAGLTRRAKRASRLAAVVVRFSRSRGRYERRGILVEEPALERAEAECLEDEEARARRRSRDEERRTAEDRRFQSKLAREIGRLFPSCPRVRAEEIARHAATRGSGRVGRTAAARDLDPEAITLAVVASIRHTETPYDELLMSGAGRAEARDRVRADVDRVLDAWRVSAT
jgi:hypothetical protein